MPVKRLVMIVLAFLLVGAMGCTEKSAGRGNQTAELEDRIVQLERSATKVDSDIEGLEKQLELTDRLFRSEVTNAMAKIDNFEVPQVDTGDRLTKQAIRIVDVNGQTRMVLNEKGFYLFDEADNQVAHLVYEEVEKVVNLWMRAQSGADTLVYSTEKMSGLAIGRSPGPLIDIKQQEVSSGGTASVVKVLKNDGALGWAAVVAPDGRVITRKSRNPSSGSTRLSEPENRVR